jgi:TonB family protein
MVSPENFSTKVLHDLKPKKLIQNTKSSSTLSRGIARMHSSERVLMSAFSPTPYPVKSIDVESEMENSLNKEELDGIWRQYTNSIQVKIGKAKKYPRLAKKRKQQGKTLLSFKLNRDGKVLDLKIESSSGYEILDQAALKAIKEGEPYPNIPETLNKKYAYLKIPISFVLKRGK